MISNTVHHSPHFSLRMFLYLAICLWLVLPVICEVLMACGTVSFLLCSVCMQLLLCYVCPNRSLLLSVGSAMFLEICFHMSCLDLGYVKIHSAMHSIWTLFLYSRQVHLFYFCSKCVSNRRWA